MKLGLRAKLFGISVLLVLSGVIAGGLILASELRDRYERNIELELARHARSARELLEASGTGRAIADIDPLADRLGAATDVRVTIVDDGGRVVGDSELSHAEVEAVENHGTRAEVVAALAHGIGVSLRYSTTIERDMLYIAVPAGPTHPGWAVRVAKPLEEVDAAIARLRNRIAFAGLIGLLAAALMSALASHWMVRTLRTIANTARAIAKGEPRQRLVVASRDEIGHLAGSLNDMAEAVENTVTELAAERSRFETVLEAMSDAVIALDDERKVTLINSAARALLGVDESPVGRSFVDLLRVPALQELIASGGGPRGRAELELPGSRRSVLARVTPMRSGQGCVVVMSDVSTLRRLETVRRDFVANVSHELRTPVSVIQANAETLIDGALEDPQHARPLLQALHRNANRMARLIADLLDLSRLEAGHYELRSEPVDIESAAAHAAEAVEGSARDKRTTVRVEALGGLVARADSKALDQVLVNLLENAVKYTPEQGHVRLTARQNGQRVRIEVSDDGPGVPAPDRKRVFERFYRIDPGRSRDMGGTGLGLSIVKHLVEGMQGTVGVEAADPRGAVFWVELPRAT